MKVITNLTSFSWTRFLSIAIASFCPLVFGGSAIAGSSSVSSRSDSNLNAISFLNRIEPILTRAGCNVGTCHGSQFGKGGFKLSLAGYDPDLDYEAITRQARGRRVSVADAANSLILTKSTLTVPHQGGLRIAKGSDDYRAVISWLQQGAPRPNYSDARPVSLIVSPERSTLRVGAHQTIHVSARFSDGSVQDVTAHTRIGSINDSVAAVTPEGIATANGCGETAIMLRYQGLAASARIVVPYAAVQNTRPIASVPGEGEVDRLIEKRWQDLRLEPSSLCTDSQFIRRASLDIIGTLPSETDVRAFEAYRRADKYGMLVDRLLDRPEYADYWALKWGDLLRNNRSTIGEKSMWALRDWIYTSLRTNMPYNLFVRDLITASGSGYATGPANFYRISKTPQELAEATAQVFLGTRLQCARCHHHPFEKWSQNDYYRFSAFFARVGVKTTQDYGPENPEPVVTLLPAGEVVHPKTGVVLTPAPLQESNSGIDIARDPDSDRRVDLADWLTSKQNGQFAQALVNRYWGYFLGRGLVHPVDDMRVTNPASNPELLAYLAQDFVSHGYDIKHLIRTICTSRVYRISAKATPQNHADAMFYTHFITRRQPAEVMLDSISTASGSPEKFAGLPLGTRAIQLPDTAVESTFLDTFGRPQRTSACECERSNEPGLTQSLQMLNGDLVNSKVTSASNCGTVTALLALPKSDTEIVTSLYYRTLSRAPRRSELAISLKALHSAVSRRQALEDLLWALINTKEFAAVQ